VLPEYPVPPEDPGPPDDPEDLDRGLAAERTRLAWARTAVAFAALGAVVLRKDVIDGLIVLAGAPLVWALGRFASREVRPEARPARLLVVSLTVIAAAAVAALVAFLGHAPASLDQILPRHG
jgi:uncharacterized membrane protein YidH (DUF202 family)